MTPLALTNDVSPNRERFFRDHAQDRALQHQCSGGLLDRLRTPHFIQSFFHR